MSLRVVVFMILVSTLFAGAARAQFIDVTAAQGIYNINEGCLFGNGLSLFDFNYDGWDDLTLANGSEEPIILMNNNGVFEPANLNLQINPIGQVEMLLWADYDNDGDADLLCSQLFGRLDLWQNDGNFNFTNVSAAAGLDQGIYKFWGCAFADYDHDGCLDLYVGKYYDILNNFNQNQIGALYHNNCDGTFTNVTESAGVHLDPRAQFQPGFFDYNHDGWEDLLIIIDRNAWQNELFMNNGDGTFTNVTVASGMNWFFEPMTLSVDDYDNDADFDVYMTNGSLGNRLFQNQNNGTFLQVASTAGVSLNQISWGSLWIDYDNNTWQDLFVGTVNFYFNELQNAFFINNADGTFTYNTDAAGITGDISPSMTSCMGDFNNDGYYDFVNNQNDPLPTKLYMNDGGSNHYLSVRLTGVFANRDGIGSWIDCYAGGNHYVRYTMCGENLTAQNSTKEIFGLADMTVVDSLVVSWNSGTVDKFYNVGVDQHLHITEGSSYAQPFYVASEPNFQLCPGDSVELDGGDYETHLWSTGDTTRYIMAGAESEYVVTVTDLFGNEFNSYPVFISLLESPVVIENTVGISCHGNADGAIELALQNGDIAWIEWGNEETMTSIQNLGPAIYEYSGEDQNGCSFFGAVAIEDPPVLEAVLTVDNPDCYDETGTVGIQVTGGTPGYTIDWNGADSLAVTSGDYSIVVWDANNCSWEGEFSVVVPDSLHVVPTAAPALCYGEMSGEVTLEISGGTPDYTIDWQGYDPSALGAGDYMCTVVDEAGCSSEVSYSISEPDELLVTVEATPEVENGNLGSAGAMVQGGTPPYLFDWGNGPVGEGTATNLASGFYTVLVIDANGCESTVNFEITLVTEVTTISAQDDFSIYQDASGNLNIRVPVQLNPSVLQLHDVTGKKVFQVVLTQEQTSIPCPTLVSGPYVVRLTGANGQSRSVQFLVN